MELSYRNEPLPRIDKRLFALVLLITLGATFALWEFPIQFIGLVVAILFLAGVYNLPELGVGVIVNGLYLVGYFWRGLEITYLITPLAVMLCTMGLLHYVCNNGQRWRFGVLPAVVLLIGVMLFVGILYSPLPAEGLEKAGRYLTVNLFIFFVTMLFIGDLNKLKNLLTVIAFSGFILAIISVAYIGFVGIETIPRFTLPGQNAIWFARGLGLSLLATLFLMELAKKRYQKFILTLFVFLLLFLIYITASRGPLLALLIVLLLYFFILQRKKLNLLKALSLFLVAFFSLKLFIAFAPGQIWNRMLSLFSGFDITTFFRLRAYGAARDLFLDNPLAGVGTGGFGHYNVLTYPHNIFLELASELGIWGPVVLLFMILYTTYLAVRLLKNQRASALESSLSRAFFAIFIFALINSQFSGEISSNHELW
ncbi:O-antigen ligase family protein, partial [bacterium]|nr:O-antigen ligase family protein [bacterium]